MHLTPQRQWFTALPLFFSAACSIADARVETTPWVSDRGGLSLPLPLTILIRITPSSTLTKLQKSGKVHFQCLFLLPFPGMPCRSSSSSAQDFSSESLHIQGGSWRGSSSAEMYILFSNRLYTLWHTPSYYLICQVAMPRECIKRRLLKDYETSWLGKLADRKVRNCEIEWPYGHWGFKYKEVWNSFEGRRQKSGSFYLFGRILRAMGPFQLQSAKRPNRKELYLFVNLCIMDRFGLAVWPIRFILWLFQISMPYLSLLLFYLLPYSSKKHKNALFSTKLLRNSEKSITFAPANE